jgi:hypothetical protein
MDLDKDNEDRADDQGEGLDDQDEDFYYEQVPTIPGPRPISLYVEGERGSMWEVVDDELMICITPPEELSASQ